SWSASWNQARLNGIIEHPLWRIPGRIIPRRHQSHAASKPPGASLSMILEGAARLERCLPTTAQQIPDQMRIEDGAFTIEKGGRVCPRVHK
ncbi:MAG TPA: hypothetical protein VE965_02665, partial [Gammaproteobacteria bacterium]|nr:hypothetical protein [Gammaproteobacteria bacterium]